MVKPLPPDDAPGMGHDAKVVPLKPNGRGGRRGLRYEWEPLATNIAWLVKNRMARTGVGALIGRGYTGKTQTLVDLAWSVVTERSWAGGRVMRPGGVVYFSAEGGLGVLRSWHAVKDLVIKPWFAQYGDPMPLEFPFALVTEMPPLLPKVDEAVKWYTDAIAEAAAVFESKFKVPVVLAVFDTLAKIAGFKNENDNSECTAAFQTLDRIAQAANVFALTADHLAKDDAATRPRGGSAKYDAADSIMRIGVGEGDGRTLYVDKVRDGEAGDEVPFKLTVVKRGIDADGDAVTSVRLSWLEQSARPDHTPGRKGKRLPDLLLALNDCYDAMLATHINVNGKPIFAVSADHLRQNYFRRSGGTTQHQRSLRDAYVRAVRQFKTAQVIDAYRFDSGEEFVWRVDQNELRQNASN
jgi:hypothetical protein